jgi:hypothetical protein
MMNGYMASCVLGAAAELDLFTVLSRRAMTAEEATLALGADVRATTMLLDAVAALGLLEKREDRYSVPEPLLPALVAGGAEDVLPMLRHRMNILRGWAQLAWTVKAGVPPPRPSSIRGALADRESFIAAMHTVSGPVADDLVARLGPPEFAHLLDVGGASGTWASAFLRAVPGSRATIFDLPDAIQQARDRLGTSELADRVTLVAGDFYEDDLPPGADYAWVSAILHQHSRAHSRELLAKVHAALVPGARVGIRDVLMEPCRTRPLTGAMFAINMLVNTETGRAYTFEEIAEDLRWAGFRDAELRIRDEGMSSVVEAVRP